MDGKECAGWVSEIAAFVVSVGIFLLMHFRQCNSLTSRVMHENKGFGPLCLCNSANWRVGKVCRDERKKLKKKKKKRASGVEDKPGESSSENREQAAYPCIISKS